MKIVEKIAYRICASILHQIQYRARGIGRQASGVTATATFMKQQNNKNCDENKQGDQPIGPTCLADLQKGIHICGDCSSPASPPPAWVTKTFYDPEKMKTLFERHAFSFCISCHTAITVGFSLPELITPLVFTGESSTPAKCCKRYFNTAME